MAIAAKHLVVAFLLAGALAPVHAAAQTAPAPQLTAKERLGEKWQDEQRVNNCKVPLDKRGSKPRPDKCADAPQR